MGSFSAATAGFAFEAFVELLAGGLDGNVAAEARVASSVNLAHAAFTEKRDDFVGRVFRRVSIYMRAAEGFHQYKLMRPPVEWNGALNGLGNV